MMFTNSHHQHHFVVLVVWLTTTYLMLMISAECDICFFSNLGEFNGATEIRGVSGGGPTTCQEFIDQQFNLTTSTVQQSSECSSAMVLASPFCCGTGQATIEIPCTSQFGRLASCVVVNGCLSCADNFFATLFNGDDEEEDEEEDPTGTVEQQQDTVSEEVIDDICTTVTPEDIFSLETCCNKCELEVTEMRVCLQENCGDRFESNGDTNNGVNNDGTNSAAASTTISNPLFSRLLILLMASWSLSVL